MPASNLVLEQPVLVDLVSDALRLQLEVKHLQAASDDLLADGLPTDHLLHSAHGQKSEYVSPHHQHLPVEALELLAFYDSAANDGASEALWQVGTRSDEVLLYLSHQISILNLNQVPVALADIKLVEEDVSHNLFVAVATTLRVVPLLRLVDVKVPLNGAVVEHVGARVFVVDHLGLETATQHHKIVKGSCLVSIVVALEAAVLEFVLLDVLHLLQFHQFGLPML